MAYCAARRGGGRPLRDEPHAAYLALFGADLVKVGVAAKWRKERRVLEQGATASLFFAAGSGGALRELEATITERAGLTDRVTVKQKLCRLWDQPDESTARQILAEALDGTRARLQRDAHTKSLPESLFRYNVPHFGLVDDVKRTERLNLIRTPREGDRITGTVAGVVGSVVFIGDGGAAPYALDIRSVNGYLATLGSGDGVHLTTPCEPVMRPVRQDALF